MIEIKNMSYAIPQSGKILEEISVSVPEKQFVGVLGRNGAGKTTLLDTIMGFRKPTEGSIEVFGQDPMMSSREIFRDVAYLSQDIWLKDNITIESFFEFNKFFHNRYSDSDEKDLMKAFQLDYKAKIGGLSTGQKRRTQIVASLAARPKLLIIDEITAVLDPEARDLFFGLLKEVNQQHNVTILLATNIVEDLKGRVHTVHFIENSHLTCKEPSEIDSLFKGGRDE